jgi:hypothetical protein
VKPRGQSAGPSVRVAFREEETSPASIDAGGVQGLSGMVNRCELLQASLM